MAYDIKGTLKRIGETQNVSERFSKMKFVIDVEDGRYSQVIEFEVTNDRIDQLRDLRDGDEVRVTFNLRGREWTSPKGEVRVFNTLDVWKVELVSGSERPRGGAHDSSPSRGDASPRKGDDDIPF